MNLCPLLDFQNAEKYLSAYLKPLTDLWCGQVGTKKRVGDNLDRNLVFWLI